MASNRPPAAGRTRTLATVLLAVLSLLAAASLVATWSASSHAASGVSRTKPKPTSTPTATQTATATTAPSPSATAPATTSPSPSPTANPTTPESSTPEPSPSPTGAGSPSPATSCGAESPVLFEGSLYCPGEIVGVQFGAYGANSRVVLEGVTVLGVSGSMVAIMGGPACLPDPLSQEPQYCGAIVPTMEVDFTGATSLPAAGTGIDLFGVTVAGGGIIPDGFITVAWCDPDWCP